jgi:hypothetical protein
MLSYVHVIEFQKRGLPHAHILLMVEDPFKSRSPEYVDKIICAEIPGEEEDPLLFKLVTTHMIHGPCGKGYPKQPCMEPKINKKTHKIFVLRDKCRKEFPKDLQDRTSIDPKEGFPKYCRRHIPPIDVPRKGLIDNRFVVPYSPHLLKKFQCHINVEICSSVQSVKYLYKYIYKGSDKANAKITNENDEIQQYLDAPYISAAEATWRIFGFKMYDTSHQIIRLPVHMPGMQRVQFNVDDDLNERLEKAAENSMLYAFFRLNASCVMHSSSLHFDTQFDSRKYLYAEIPEHFTFKNGQWNPRLISGKRQVVRLHGVDPSDAERYYLRLLLLHVRGPTSFEDLRTVGGFLLPSFQAAALALNLINDDRMWADCMRDAALYQMPKQLRTLFVVICVHCDPPNRSALFEEFLDDMSEDIKRRLTQLAVHLRDPARVIRSLCLTELQKIFRSNRKSLEHFNLETPQEIDIDFSEPAYDRITEAQIGESMRDQLNGDQFSIFDEIVTAVFESSHDDSNQSRIFFIDAPGGTGKTFLIETLMHFLRGMGKCVVAVASTGIASQLLPGGKTAHSQFGIPLELEDKSTSSIGKQHKKATELRECDLMIWDEVPMAHWRTASFMSLFLELEMLSLSRSRLRKV